MKTYTRGTKNSDQKSDDRNISLLHANKGELLIGGRYRLSVDRLFRGLSKRSTLSVLFFSLNARNGHHAGVDLQLACRRGNDWPIHFT